MIRVLLRPHDIGQRIIGRAVLVRTAAARAVRCSERRRAVMPRYGFGIRVAAAAAPAAVTSGPKILPVCVRGHLIDGERVFLLAAHLAVYWVFWPVA